MAGRWTLTVRRRGRTERERYDEPVQAVAALERRLVALERTERRTVEKAFVREVAPVAQVAARLELAGPGGARGGVDLRGDGTSEAYTGRWRRELVARQPGEDAVAALRRVLDA